MKSGLLGACLIVLVATTVASADPYFNSSECPISAAATPVNPDHLLCDDFEDGIWYRTNGDTAGGPNNPDNDGWGGGIFSGINPPDAAVCGAGVTPFGNCAATAGPRSGGGSNNIAMHKLKTAGCGGVGNAFAECGVNELYVRWYAKWMPGYQFGNEKHITVTNNGGDIAFVGFYANGCGVGSPTSTGDPRIAVNYGTINDGGGCGPQNQGNSISLVPGRWYFFEGHVKAGSQGLIELWVNDCGTAGTTCGAAPILRSRYGTGAAGSPVSLPGNSNGSQITNIWFDFWTGVPSTGTGPLVDNLVVSRTGPIGFVSTGPALNPPSGLRACEGATCVP